MGATFSRVKVWIAGETLTAADLNSEFNNILNNLTPAGIDDQSTNATAMQVTVDPYPAASESLSTDLAGELHRLRYVIKQITGEAQWYIDPDGTLATLFTAITVGAGSQVNLPAQPAFSVYPAATQSNIAVGSAVTVVFGTEKFDVGSDFSANTFTAPVDGKYHFDVALRLNGVDSASSFYEVKLVTTSKTYSLQRYAGVELSSDTNNLTLGGSILADMSATDTAHVTITQGSGTQQTDILVDSYYTGFLAT